MKEAAEALEGCGTGLMRIGCGLMVLAIASGVLIVVLVAIAA